MISVQSAIDHLKLSLDDVATIRNGNTDSFKISSVGIFSRVAHNVSGSAIVMDNGTLQIGMFNFYVATPILRFYAGVNANFYDSAVFGTGARIDASTRTGDQHLCKYADAKHYFNKSIVL